MASADMARLRSNRWAGLAVVSSTIPAERMGEIIGCPADKVRIVGEPRADARVPIPSREHSWEILEKVSADFSLQTALDRIAARILPLEHGLVQAHEQGCTVILSLVQTIHKRENPGLVIMPELSRLLGSLEAPIDIDQYL